MVSIGVIAFAVLAAVVYFSFKAYVFASPENCTACHFIAPFYNKWKTSTHNKVSCLKCHDYKPINAVVGQLRFLVGTYNPRPMTRVPDENCLQGNCHDRRLIESEATFTKWGISLDHKPHFKEMRRGIKLHCRSCHSDIVQGEHVKASKNVCFLCHFKGVTEGQALTGCPSCHSTPEEDIVFRGEPFSHKEVLSAGIACGKCHVNVIEGTGEVPKDKCFFCHVERTEMYDDVNLIHERHVAEKQLDCLHCHPRIKHGHIKMADKVPEV
jgi:hypothetical protein